MIELVTKEDILREANAQGFATASLSSTKLLAFVACVLSKLLFMSLPEAVASCAKDFF